MIFKPAVVTFIIFPCDPFADVVETLNVRDKAFVSFSFMFALISLELITISVSAPFNILKPSVDTTSTGLPSSSLISKSVTAETTAVNISININA